MKKKIINGILLVALIFATSSVFVSCKDNDSDVQTELLGKIASLQQQINDLKGVVGPQGPQGPQGEQGAPGQDGHSPVVTIGDNGNWFIDGVDTGKSAKGEDGAPGQPGSTPTIEIGDNGNWFINGEDTGKPSKGDDATVSTEILDQIGDIEDAINDLKDQVATKDDLDDAIDAIQSKINDLADQIAAIYTTEVTSLNVDAVENSLFGFVSAPLDFQTNVLITCYGKATSDVDFYGFKADAGDLLLNGEGNSGVLYCTVNPSSVNFTGKTLSLVSTQGEQAPITLAPLELSDEEITFGGTRASVDNAFYEAQATMNVVDINNAMLHIAKADLREVKDDVIDLVKQRNRRTLWDLGSKLYTIYAKNDMTAYRLKAAWGAGNTYSEAKIAAIALKPLDFTFDIDAATIVDPVIEFEKDFLGEDYFEVNHRDHAKKAAQKWLNEFNKDLGKAVENINASLQPLLLVREGDRIYRAQYSYSKYVTLIPTSWTAEMFAPAFKKYVKVTCEGETIYESGAVDGFKLQAIPLTLESGKTYDIVYSALDFSGNVRTQNYTISGK
jgi:prefoldin subunit 5